MCVNLHPFLRKISSSISETVLVNVLKNGALTLMSVGERNLLEVNHKIRVQDSKLPHCAFIFLLLSLRLVCTYLIIEIEGFVLIKSKI